MPALAFGELGHATLTRKLKCLEALARMIHTAESAESMKHCHRRSYGRIEGYQSVLRNLLIFFLCGLCVLRGE